MHTVTDADTAAELGSGDLPVLATPRLISWLERLTHAVARTAVPEGQTTVGTLVSGSSYAYTYLPQSSKAFMEPEALAEAFRVAGLRLVRFKRLMFGTIAIHVGVK